MKLNRFTKNKMFSGRCSSEALEELDEAIRHYSKEFKVYISRVDFLLMTFRYWRDNK